MMLTALGEQAKVDNVTAHRFRHAFACEHYRRNRDLLALKSALGHAKIETTMLYLRGLGIDFAMEAKAPPPDEWLLAGRYG